MEMSNVVVSCLPVLSFFITIFTSVSFVTSQNGGFSINLYHIDSPDSPFYDPTISESERARRAINRSNARLTSFRSVTPQQHSLKSPIIRTTTSGEYLMRIALGSKQMTFFVVVDTGSDLTWTQCRPCIDCYEQDTPIFDPEIHSKTYKKITCIEGNLNFPGPPGTDSVCYNNICVHSVRYADDDNSTGVLSSDTLTLGSTSGGFISVPDFVFGCGHENQGHYSPQSAGVAGLGAGPKSLVNQLGRLTNGRFAYCLVPGGRRASTIHFGDAAALQGPEVATTPLIIRQRPKLHYLYFVTLLGFTVADEYVPFTSRFGHGVALGNIYIDSGTTLTYLPREFYDRFFGAVRRRTSGNEVPNPNAFGDFEMCYHDDARFRTPPIKVHFNGAAALHLSLDNTFWRTRHDDFVCFGFRPDVDFPCGTYGNLAQLNFLVGFDRRAGTISFKPTDC